MIKPSCSSSLSLTNPKFCAQWGNNDGLMQTLYPLPSQLLLQPAPPFALFFLPSLPNFHSSLSLSVFSYPVQASFHKVSIEAREKGSAAAAAGHSFLQGRYRGAGSSLHERAPLLRLHSALPLPQLFTKALLCQEQGSTEKKEGSPFSLFVLHIAIQAFPKPPLMSWPLQCCEQREKQV